MSDRDLRHELSAIRAPTLLVWGERDRLVPLRIAEEWRQAMVDVRLEYLHCGHVPMLEAPAELAACMLSFLDDELAESPQLAQAACSGRRVACRIRLQTAPGSSPATRSAHSTKERVLVAVDDKSPLRSGSRSSMRSARTEQRAESSVQTPAGRSSRAIKASRENGSRAEA